MRKNTKKDKKMNCIMGEIKKTYENGSGVDNLKEIFCPCLVIDEFVYYYDPQENTLNIQRIGSVKIELKNKEPKIYDDNEGTLKLFLAIISETKKVE